jgi:hypothetical protein
VISSRDLILLNHTRIVIDPSTGERIIVSAKKSLKAHDNAPTEAESVAEGTVRAWTLMSGQVYRSADRGRGCIVSRYVCYVVCYARSRLCVCVPV